jgi:very-short-patch-repair endonuclease
MRKPNVKCEICGKPLYRRPSELKKTKHICCKDCRSELYKKYKNYHIGGLKRGRGWNKGLSKKNGDNLSYGKPRSKETKQHISQALKAVLVKKGEIRKCSVCQKEFYNYPSSNKRYCSRKCTNIAKINQEIRICEYCKKEFSTNKKRVQTLCSRQCALLCRRQTDIEKIIEDWLKSNKIKYQNQVPLCGITIADFLVETNIVIYCDGDYWHKQSLVKRKDYLQNRTLKESGYKVIRLWGSDIKRGVRPKL